LLFQNVWATFDFGMSNSLAIKAPALQEIIERLISDIGPDRVVPIVRQNDDAESIVATLRSDPSRMVFISITGMKAGRYTVSYDQLIIKRKGDASVENQISSGVAYEGLRWIVRKIFDNGVVTGEFETLPEKRKIRR